MATSSGNDLPMEGRFNGDPYCAPVCPGCGTEWPQTRVEGIGPESVRCADCGADATPFTFTHGYTIAFDEARGRRRHRRARGGRALRRATRRASPRCPTARPRTRSSAFAPHDIVALATRLRPFMGQLGTSPSATIPDSHNAGDFGAFLIGAPHRFAMTRRRGPAPQDRRPHGHRRGARGRDPRVPGEGRRRRRLHGRHARAPGRRRDRRAHLRRRRHRDPARSRSSRAWASTAPCSSRSPRTCPSWRGR